MERGRQTRSQASGGGAIAASNITTIVTEVINAIQPLIVNSITAAVTQVITIATSKLTDILHQNSTIVADLKKRMKQQSYQLEKMEQYTRRDNLKLKGIKHEANEDTTDIVMNVASSIGVDVRRDDISTSHRLGPSEPNKPSPIIVRFAKRDKKVSIMKNKKNLKDDIYVEEDLTKMRRNMFYEIRRHPNTIKSWTIEGKIYALMKEGNSEVKKVFENPDDLYKLGWNEAKLDAFLERK